MQQPVPQLPLPFLECRLHINCAEDHVLRGSKRQLHNLSRRCKGRSRTNENRLCRTVCAGDQKSACTWIDKCNRKCAPCMLLSDNGRQRITRDIQNLSSEKLFSQDRIHRSPVDRALLERAAAHAVCEDEAADALQILRRNRTAP